MIKYIKPLPVSEEMLGAYLEGNLTAEDSSMVQGVIDRNSEFKNFVEEVAVGADLFGGDIQNICKAVDELGDKLGADLFGVFIGSAKGAELKTGGREFAGGNAGGELAAVDVEGLGVHGLGGADGMAAGTKAQSNGQRIFQSEQLDQQRCRHVAADSRNDDRNRGDGDHAALRLGNRCGNGSGNRLGQHGDRHSCIQTEQAAHRPNTDDRRHRTGKTAQQHRQQILLQKLPLGVNAHRHTGGGRAQHHLDHGSALEVGIIRDIEYHQNRNNQNAGNDEAVAKGRFHLLLDRHANAVGNGRQRNSKKGRFQQNIHSVSPFLRFRARRVSWTTHAVTPKVSTVVTKLITSSATAFSAITST